jgi:DNA-binding protein HU-beta
VNRSELIAEVSRRTGRPRAVVAEVARAVVDVIAETLDRGGTVQVYGLGIFETVRRAPKVGRNPTTGETVHIPARRVVKFRAAKQVRERIARTG